MYNYKDMDDEYKRKNATVFLKNVSMTFGHNKALDSVDLAIMPGEIHGLLGQNGCGKSTLIKILSGFNHPDSGSKLYINGNKIKLPLDPDMISKYGLSFVHQDLGLVSSLSVLENLRMEHLFQSGAKINWKKERAEAKAILEKYGIDVNIDDNIETLNQVDKAMISIVRAVESILSRNDGKGLLVLDEPTVFLALDEVNMLFRLVREIAAGGIGVLFVSHDLDEVMTITDIVTVLRDGVNCGEAVTSETSKDGVIEMILGQKLTAFERDSSNYRYAVHPDAIYFKNIKGEVLRGVDFSVNPGEIVGVTGLEGSGFGEIPYVICGENELQDGKMVISHKTVDLGKYDMKQAIEDNIALIPADRPNQGGIQTLRVEENVMMQVHKFYHPLMLQSGKMREKAEELNVQYSVTPNDVRLNFSQLSGGNQQKVILAKWLQEPPVLLILHEPTQGVDVGARQQIYKHIDQIVKRGAAVLCASSDYEQLVQICDRVIIFSRGRIVDTLSGPEITKERIVQLCYNSAAVQQ
ncbi:sugar ABC transporter ATP-binding protein [Papillibacter cinnamivorans]|uniref:Ribose transport system ATP-binding protein n=1 Tax=Papillibacter cinnamivorans DSM 12816 TaxID=1122930 RepID=A0A1W2BG58_9FIRM|nr:sugar ABC transporter ATP-binding protein [Papillibacter cinnamivorans]SMC71732.1 ribose transport system ATP-binding protein [Papillibacter cinnamivorans DSM 12816]